MNLLTRPYNRPGKTTVFDQIFDDLWGDFKGLESTSFDKTLKPLRVVEKDDKYLVSVDLPGVSKENANVEINDGILTIKAERRDYWASEYGKSESLQKFERSFSIPTTVDIEKADAHIEDGVLNIVLPKLASSKGRKIEVGSKSDGFWKKLVGKSDEEKN